MKKWHIYHDLAKLDFIHFAILQRAISSIALNLLAGIEKSNFIAGLVICIFFFKWNITLPLSKYLQKPVCDFSSVQNHALMMSFQLNEFCINQEARNSSLLLLANFWATIFWSVQEAKSYAKETLTQFYLATHTSSSSWLSDEEGSIFHGKHEECFLRTSILLFLASLIVLGRTEVS